MTDVTDVDRITRAIDRGDGLALSRALFDLPPGSITADPARFAAAAIRATLDPDPEDRDAFFAMLGGENA